MPDGADCRAFGLADEIGRTDAQTDFVCSGKLEKKIEYISAGPCSREIRDSTNRKQKKKTVEWTSGKYSYESPACRNPEYLNVPRDKAVKSFLPTDEKKKRKWKKAIPENEKRVFL